jgi:hypothetical protein
MKRILCSAAAIVLTALGAGALAQLDEDFLFPVTFTVYLAEGNPLYPFAVGHPCGKIVTLRANRVPVDVATVRPMWAYELSGDGKIMTRWATPVDATPLAVDGDRLTIHQLEAEKVVFVTPGFDIGTTVGGPDPAALKNMNEHRVECPVNAENFNEIQYLLCSEMTDGTTGRVRIVAYAPVCT